MQKVSGYGNVKDLKEFYYASPYSFFNEILIQKRRIKNIEKENLRMKLEKRAKTKQSKSINKFHLLQPVLETTEHSHRFADQRMKSHQSEFHEYQSDLRSNSSIIAIAHMK